MFVPHGAGHQGRESAVLNAAYRLLGQRMERAEAARHLGREFALSRRQAYRYLQEAAGLSDPVPAVEPTVAVTFKLPVSTVRAIRAYARRSGLSLGQVVARAVTALLDTVHQRRG